MLATVATLVVEGAPASQVTEHCFVDCVRVCVNLGARTRV